MFHVIPFYVRVCYQIEGSDSYFGASLVAQTVKNLSVMQETQVQSLAWEDPLEKRNGYPLQHSFLENSVDRGVWGTIVHGVAKSQTQLRD